MMPRILLEQTGAQWDGNGRYFKNIAASVLFTVLQNMLWDLNATRFHKLPEMN